MIYPRAEAPGTPTTKTAAELGALLPGILDKACKGEL
jgi:hypothetical protein